MTKLRIGIVGTGMIARNQHIPAIIANEAFELVGSVDPAAHIAGVQSHPSLQALVQATRPDAVAVCTPPQVRHTIARAALGAGLHVLLEKPPCATIGELEDLAACAQRVGVSLYTAWHSQHAAAVGAARDWIGVHRARRIRVEWREDVRRWHPGQQWIWQPGGLGVFDPGINALSILTSILDAPLYVIRARLDYPANQAAPIAASLDLAAGGEVTIAAEFDWRLTGTQTWDIAVEAADGAQMLLSMGGTRISTQATAPPDALEGEYPAIYRRFAALVASRRSEVHAAPLRVVADAFLIGERTTVAPFDASA
ncbi:MAG: Gfo/Idh/MocA family protein [Steroidobacteraceae bacterium]